MPSPFPGMDPYLENPTRWPGVHHRLISEIQTALNAQLRPKYYATVEERIYISDETDPGREVLVPDVRVARRSSPPPMPAEPATVATLEVTESEEVTILLDEEIHEARLEIIDRAADEIVVVIEILSPSNKIAGSEGRRSFVAKRRDVMRSPSHWVEIDLLRGGVPILNRSSHSPCEYRVYTSHSDRRPRGRVWPIRLKKPLPVIAIPLRGADPDVRLDLQQILTTSYDHGAYDMAIDYSRLPVPPLSDEDAAWADALLREKGLRK